MKHPDELLRLRKEYEDRKSRFSGSNRYSLFNPANLFAIQQRQRTIIKLLQKRGFTTLSDLRILEIGCGSGGVLSEFMSFGAFPGNITGVDLIHDRLAHANAWLPGSYFINADGQFLPFPAKSFDLVIQFTALSSVLDPAIRQKICIDMLRVLRSSGFILWYDFWLNPTNQQTHGIQIAEVRSLFPDCFIEFHKITLAPPIARRVVPISRTFALLLEKLKIFNSHYLASIWPINGSL